MNWNMEFKFEFDFEFEIGWDKNASNKSNPKDENNLSKTSKTLKIT